MGAKVWSTAAVVIAAAAAAGAGIVTWEGRVWDEHAQDLASYKEAPVKTVILRRRLARGERAPLRWRWNSSMASKWSGRAVLNLD